MKKLLLAIVGVAALCLVALPPVLGTVAAGQVPERVAALDSHPLLEAELASLERGWFSSTARIEIVLNEAGRARFNIDPASKAALPVVLELEHGPVAFGESLSLGLAHVVARPDANVPHIADLQRELGVPYLFEFRGRSGFGGGLDYEAHVPAIDYADGGMSLQTSDARIEGTLDGDRLVSHGELDTLDWSAQGSTLSLRQVRTDADNRLVTPFQLIGDFQAAAARAMVRNAAAGDAALLDVTGIDVSGHIELDEDEVLSDGRFEIGAEALSAGAEADLANAAMALAWTRIDTVAVRDYLEIVERAEAADALDPSALASQVLPIAEQLIAAEPRFSMDPLAFEWDGEPFEASLDVTARPEALPLPAGPGAANAALWLELFDGSARLSASKALTRRLVRAAVEAQIAASGDVPPEQVEARAAAQTGLTLALLTGPGFLEDRGERYFTEVLLEDGRLTINGSPLPFGLLP